MKGKNCKYGKPTIRSKNDETIAVHSYNLDLTMMHDDIPTPKNSDNDNDSEIIYEMIIICFNYAAKNGDNDNSNNVKI